MTTVAFLGGSSLCELGPREDVTMFFALINQLQESCVSATGFELITDRLYRRYIGMDLLEPACRQMQMVREEFDRIPTSSVAWQQPGMEPFASWLNLALPTLAKVFHRYFELFHYCVESVRLNFEEFSAYPGYRFEPVRVVTADQPWFMADKNRPLKEYDALEGLPFWLQTP